MEKILRYQLKMANGLTMTLGEFEKLPNKEQHNVLFQNQCKTMELVAGYKFHQKVQYVLIGLLTTGVGVLIKMHLG